jgi:hypothetical protein
MRKFRIATYVILLLLGLLFVFFNALATRMNGREDAGGGSLGWALLFLGLAGTGALYEWAFWKRALRLRERNVKNAQFGQRADAPDPRDMM